MKEIEISKSISKGIFLKAVCFIEALLFLFTLGCVPQKAELSSAPTPSLAVGTQLENKEAESTSNISPTPTSIPDVTPIDASSKTPEGNENEIKNDVSLYLLTDDELKLVEKEAEKYNLEMSKAYSDEYRYDNDSVLISIRNLMGDFVALNHFRYDPSDKNQVLNAETYCFREMTEFISNHYSRFFDNLTDYFLSGGEFKPVYLNLSTLYKYKNNAALYNGLDLLEMQEKLFEDMCNSITDNWEAFSEKAVIYQAFVENVYLNKDQSTIINGQVLTSFTNTHTIIKLVLLENAECQLRVIYIAENCKDQSIIDANHQLDFSCLELFKIVIKEVLVNSDVFYELIPLIEDYINYLANKEATSSEGINDVKPEFTPSSTSGN